MKIGEGAPSFKNKKQSLKCVISQNDYAGKSIPVSYSMFNNISICLTSISREFKLDVVDTLIYVTVAAANLESLCMNGITARRVVAADDDDISMYRPISQSSLARSIGLPRQTVRRRVEQLAAAGWLVLSPDGVRVGRTREQDAVKAELAVSLLNVVCRSINQMIDANVIAVQNN